MKKSTLVEYYSNNSGGSDWLDDKQWDALEEAGWKLFGFESFVYDKGSHKMGADGLPERNGDRPDRPKYAFKRFSGLFPERQAKSEFEDLTNEYADEEGCPCCGKPHSFMTH